MSFVAAGMYGPEVVLNGNLITPVVLALTSVTVKNTDNSAATLYTDRTKATTTSNVITTDAAGRLTFFADPGQYKIAYTDTVGAQSLTVSVSLDPGGLSGSNLLIYGNSYALGTGASTAALDFTTLAARALGMTEVNNAVGGEQTYEILARCYNDDGTKTFDGSALTAGLVVFCNTINDVRFAGNVASGYATTGTTMAALLELFSGALRVEETAFTLTGAGWATWNNTPGVFRPSQGTSKKTGTDGEYFEFTAVGDSVTIYGVGFDTGTTLGVKYTVDTVDLRTVQYGSRASVRTPAIFPIYGERLTGMGDGSHTIRVTKVSGTGNLFADAVTYPASTPPPVVIVPALKLPSASYALYSPFNNGSDAAVDLYNQLVAGIARRFDHVRIADVDTWNTATMVHADGIHPNDLGHKTIAAAVVAAARVVAR